jgi:predicted secreted protein
MADAKLISAYNRGYEEGYYRRQQVSAANMQTEEQMDAFNKGYKDGEEKRNG